MLIPARHVHHSTGPHGTAVIDVRRETWLMLNQDASHIWRAITVRGDTTGVADEIAIRTGQDRQQVGNQITAFVAELVAAGVLIDTDRPRRARRRWWWR